MNQTQKNEIRKIISQSQSIESYADIAIKIGANEEEVKLFLNENEGVFLWDYRGCIPNVVHQKIIRMRTQDQKPVTTIAKDVGYSTSKIKKILNDNNISTDFRKK